MKVQSLLAAAALAALLSPSVARAAAPISLQARTAAELAELCAANPKDPMGDAKINFCHGFAQGAITVQLKLAGDKKPFCFPTPPPTRTATMAEFVNWVRAVPERKTQSAADGLLNFLGERFPCK
jgi:hypothetical protein